MVLMCCPLVAAWGQKPEHQPGNTVYEIMVGDVVPGSEQVWDLSGQVWSDDGDIDGTLLTGEQWQQIGQASLALERSGQVLAGPGPVVVAPVGTRILNDGVEGAPGAGHVQALIANDPDGFRAAAMEMVAIAQALTAAVDARNGEALDQASGELAGVCADCHQRYWLAPP